MTLSDKTVVSAATAAKMTRRTLMVSALLGLLTAAAFWGLHRNGFISVDDGTYITANPHVLSGLTLRDLSWALSAVHGANWHPLTWLSHQLDVQLFGVRPGAHHLVSLFIHLANTILLFLVLRGMTGAIWRSALVAALFGVHPLHVESVAWAAERKDVLSALFGLLALGAYLANARRPGTRAKLAVLVLFALGLTAKPMLVTFPFLLLLLDWWPLGRGTPWGFGSGRSSPGVLSPLRLWGEKIPLFILAVVAAAVTYTVQAGGGTVAPWKALPAGLRLANALSAYLLYIGQTAWPRHLAIFYPYSLDMLHGWFPFVAAFVLAGLTAGVLVRGRRNPHLIVGWFWYLGTLIPVIGLVQVGSQAKADRYTYLPLIGIFLLSAWVLGRVVEERPRLVWPCAAGALAALVLLALLTQAQVGVWRDSLSLFRHALVVTSGNYIAYNSVGTILASRGETAEAMAAFGAGLDIRPADEDLHVNIGHLLLAQGDAAAAAKHYRAALAVAPRAADAQNGLGNALLVQGDIAGAEGHFQDVLRREPDLPEAHLGLGRTLAARGKFEEAIAHYRAAIRTAPVLVEARYNLGNLLVDRGDLAGAIDHYGEAIRINPRYEKAHNNLGRALAMQGDLEAAIVHFRAALALNPSSLEAADNLRRALSIAAGTPAVR